MQSITGIWPANRPVEDSDFLMHANPINLTMRLCVDVITPRMQVKEKDLHDALRERGYLVGWGEELGRGPVGHLGLLFAQAGGFGKFTNASESSLALTTVSPVSDVGCSQKIIDGKVKVRGGVTVARLDEREILLSDGTKLEGDVLVFA